MYCKHIIQYIFSVFVILCRPVLFPLSHYYVILIEKDIIKKSHKARDDTLKKLLFNT